MVGDLIQKKMNSIEKQFILYELALELKELDKPNLDYKRIDNWRIKPN